MKKFTILIIAFTVLNFITYAQWTQLITPTVNYELSDGCIIDLEIDLDGNPYVSYMCDVPEKNSNGFDDKVFVQKYDNTTETWIQLGNYVNENSGAWQSHLAIDSLGNVYVAYLAFSNTLNNCILKKFNGNNCETIGDWDTDYGMSEV
jgi:WD40 repeat protein